MFAALDATQTQLMNDNPIRDAWDRWCETHKDELVHEARSRSTNDLHDALRDAFAFGWNACRKQQAAEAEKTTKGQHGSAKIPNGSKEDWIAAIEVKLGRRLYAWERVPLLEVTERHLFLIEHLVSCAVLNRSTSTESSE